MRHRLAGRKLGKKTAHRWAMFRNLASSLIQHGRIRTTLPRAKELRRIAEQLVTLSKNDTLHTRRQAFDFIRNRDAVVKLFSFIAPAFKTRSGGYTRIYRTGRTRPGDQSKMAYIEYLQEDLDAAAQPTDSKKAKPKVKKAKKEKGEKIAAEKQPKNSKKAGK